MTPQQTAVFKRLQQGTATTGQLRALGVSQPATRIFELKGQGKKIKKRMISVRSRWSQNTRVAQYYLVRCS